MDYQDLVEIYSESGLKEVFSQVNQRNYLWQIALPKSGSTWLTNIMSNIYMDMGWSVGRLVPLYGRRNQEIDPRYFFQYGSFNSNVFFIQQHCVYSDYTHYLINISRTKCILQVRNLFDVAVSVYDHVSQVLDNGHNELKNFPKGVSAMNKEMLMDYVIHVEMPWYIKYVEGWYNSPLMKTGKIFKVKYEEMLYDVVSSVKGIIEFAELNVSEETIINAIGNTRSANTRFNKGKIGRGSEVLNDKQIEYILKLGKLCGMSSDFELLII